MKLTLVFILITYTFCGIKKTNEMVKCEYEEYDKLTTAFANETINRPLFHFTPEFGWMNDPNGMWVDSNTNPPTYHLYFQYNPRDTVWGMPLLWGHATTTNLIDWERKKPAFGPDDGKAGAYSGSCFIDDDNKSGWFYEGTEENPENTVTPTKNIIAAYTYNDLDWIETQYLYFSDDGDTFYKIKEDFNPVVEHDNKNFEKQFRDPQVVKFKDEKGTGYLMSVAKSQEYKIAFYLTRGDFKKTSWKKQNDLELEGFLGFQYECPNLAHLKNNPDEHSPYTDDSYWVLFISINPGSITGGSSTWYLFGHFEEKKVEEDAESLLTYVPTTKYPAPLDYGKDFYAMQIFYEVRNTTELEKGAEYVSGLAWASNWQYTGSVPTDPWRSSMSLPRKISIGHFQSSTETKILYLKSEPFINKNASSNFNFPSLTEVFSGELKGGDSQIKKIDNNEKPNLEGAIEFEISIKVLNTSDFNNDNPGHLDFYFKGHNDPEEYLRFGYEQGATAFYLDRSHSKVPWVNENPYFSDKISLNVMPKEESDAGKDQIFYYVHGFIDRNIIELFFNEGYQTSTNTFFFTGGNFINEVEIKCDHGENGFKIDFKAAQITKK